MAAGSAAGNGGGSAPPAPFLSKTYEMVDDPETDAVVSWGPTGNSFVVWGPPELGRDLLPKYFKHSNFSSFVRQLNTYGFRKVDPDRWEFANEGFLRGQKHLLKTITRRKPAHGHSQQQQPQTQNPPANAAIEVGKFGLEEEIERLKRDKELLRNELARLRHQQQHTELELKTLGKRLQGMEQRQQQMMSFLAKAVQSPGFWAQVVQQNDSNRRITGGSKKRRLPKQENNLEDESTLTDSQIIKFQPLINEAAKAMFKQFLKMDPSTRMEALNNAGSFLIENGPPTLDAVDSSNSARNSGVTIAEVPPTSGAPPYAPVSSAVPTIPPSPSLSDIQSSPISADMVATTKLPDMSIPDSSMLSPIPEAVLEFPDIQGISSDGNVVGIPSETYPVPEAEGIYANPETDGANGSAPVDTEEFGPDGILIDVDKFLDIDDFLWDDLYSPISGEAEEADSSLQEGGTTEMQIELDNNGWDNVQNMAHLTEKMEHLTSETKN